MNLSKVLCTLIAISLSSCSFFSDSDERRTLPHALPLDLVSINELNQKVDLPGEYNVRAYVVSIAKCPDKVLCILADGILVHEFTSEGLNEEEIRENGIHLITDDPEQFDVGGRYEISVSIDHERVDGASWPVAFIEGYDIVKK